MFFYYYSKYFTFYFLLRFIHQTSYFLGIPTFLSSIFYHVGFHYFFLVFFHEGAVVTRLTEQDIYITNKTRTRRSLSMREHDIINNNILWYKNIYYSLFKGSGQVIYFRTRTVISILGDKGFRSSTVQWFKSAS